MTARPVHVHAGEDESWYVVEGTLRFRIGDEHSEAPAGSFVLVPPRRAARLPGTSAPPPARILVIFTPSGMEAFFDRFAAASGPPDPALFRSLGSEVGMDVVGPPLAAGEGS